MMSVIIVVTIVCFLVAYKYYGAWLSKYFLSDKEEEMPSVYLRDDMDYFPSPLSILFAHHFSSIAGAGAIVGPVVAGAMFGWVPALLWLILGCIFVGGVHDLSALAVSLKYDGLSIAEVVQRILGRKVQMFFLAFVWIFLVLVVASFLDITAVTFTEAPEVGFTVVLTVIAAFILGIGVYVFHISLRYATLFLMPFFFYALYYGANNIEVFRMFDLPLNYWRVALVGYCYLACVLPLWLLMEPRDYIASFFLYAGIFLGVAGMFVTGTQVQVNMLEPFRGWNAISGNSYLWPMLFITIACGAVSGAHSMISSGTTPKQLAKKEQALDVGYGSMLLEGVVGVIALGTVMLNGDFIAHAPLNCFAVGFGRMLEYIGIEHHLGNIFGFMVINCFVLTTLDTIARVGRYLLQELTHNRLSSFMATSLTLLAALSLMILESDGKRMWELFWPAFGAINQLVAGMTLLVVFLWLVMNKFKRTQFVFYPTVFMLATSLAALFLLMVNNNLWFIRTVSALFIVLTAYFMWLVHCKINLVQVIKDYMKKEN